MSLGSVPPQSPLVPPPNGSVPPTSTTSTDNTGTPNTPPVVKQKVPKSEFKKLTNEWNETHEKLTANFRELNVIFADIKFLLQKLELQLAAAGIKSGVSDCVEEVQSCLESFSNANAHAAALNIHFKQLDENVVNNAPQDVQDTLKILREKVTQAGNIGKAIGIPGAAQNASGTQSTPPAAPTSAVTQSTSPTDQLSFAIQGCKNLLPNIERNVSKIENDINSVNGKIKGLKGSPSSLAEGPQKIREKSLRLFTAWKTTKDLFDEEKKKKDVSIGLGTSQSVTDQKNYQLKLDQLRNQSSTVIGALQDMLKQLEDIENKTKSMSVNLKQLEDDNNKINSLIEQTEVSINEAHIDLNDSLQVIDQSNLGKKVKKEINVLKTSFNEKDNVLKIREAQSQLIDTELTELSKFSVEMSEQIAIARNLCEEAISRLQKELSELIWM